MWVRRVSPLTSGLVLTIALFLPGFTQTATAKQDKSPKPVPQSKVDASQYVGTDTCKTCHEDVFKNFETTPHHKTLTTNWGPDRKGCESCHGPGKAHVDSGGDPTKIINPKNLSAKNASQICLSCHLGQEHSNFARSAHLSNGVGCTSCHDPHHYQVRETLLAKPQPTLCYSCHADKKAEFAKPFHHRVNEGLVQCSDCHNEHGGFESRQLRAGPAGDAVCFKCHTEKQGPFVFEHVPIKTEGCTACHTPHGSTNARLLRVSTVNLLCLQCHTPGSPRTNSDFVGGIPGIPTFHNQNQKYQACTMCHAQIHGSNFSEFFFR